MITGLVDWTDGVRERKAPVEIVIVSTPIPETRGGRQYYAIESPRIEELYMGGGAHFESWSHGGLRANWATVRMQDAPPPVAKPAGRVTRRRGK